MANTETLDKFLNDLESSERWPDWAAVYAMFGREPSCAGIQIRDASDVQDIYFVSSNPFSPPEAVIKISDDDEVAVHRALSEFPIEFPIPHRLPDTHTLYDVVRGVLPVTIMEFYQTTTGNVGRTFPLDIERRLLKKLEREASGDLPANPTEILKQLQEDGLASLAEVVALTSAATHIFRKENGRCPLQKLSLPNNLGHYPKVLEQFDLSDRSRYAINRMLKGMELMEWVEDTCKVPRHSGRRDGEPIVGRIPELLGRGGMFSLIHDFYDGQSLFVSPDAEGQNIIRGVRNVFRDFEVEFGGNVYNLNPLGFDTETADIISMVPRIQMERHGFADQEFQQRPLAEVLVNYAVSVSSEASLDSVLNLARSFYRRMSDHVNSLNQVNDHYSKLLPEELFSTYPKMPPEEEFIDDVIFAVWMHAGFRGPRRPCERLKSSVESYQSKVGGGLGKKQVRSRELYFIDYPRTEGGIIDPSQIIRFLPNNFHVDSTSTRPRKIGVWEGGKRTPTKKNLEFVRIPFGDIYSITTQVPYYMDLAIEAADLYKIRHPETASIMTESIQYFKRRLWPYVGRNPWDGCDQEIQITEEKLLTNAV